VQLQASSEQLRVSFPLSFLIGYVNRRHPQYALLMVTKALYCFLENEDETPCHTDYVSFADLAMQPVDCKYFPSVDNALYCVLLRCDQLQETFLDLSAMHICKSHLDRLLTPCIPHSVKEVLYLSTYFQAKESR
jgi:hypothetical protein